MSKKKIVLTVIALVLIAAALYVGMRIKNRWTDINGVTTVYERNTVYMNSKPGKDFYAGVGYLTVGENKKINAEYDIESGSVDLAFRKYVEKRPTIRPTIDVTSSAFDNLPDSGDVFGKSGVSGKGTLNFEAAAGDYEVYFKSHDSIGSAVVTVK